MLPRWLHLVRLWSPEGDGTGPGQGGEPDLKPGESDKKYSQEEYQHGINAALAKEKSRTDKKVGSATSTAVTSFLEERGLSEEVLDELVALREGKKDDVAKSSAELAKYQRESKQMADEKAKLSEQRDRYLRLHHESLTTGAIRKHAQALGVHDADDVVSLLGKYVRATDEDAVEVLDEQGDPTHLTVEQLVKQTVEQKPYLQQKSAREGGGSLPAIGRNGKGTEGHDWGTPEGKRAILQELDEKGLLRG